MVHKNGQWQESDKPNHVEIEYDVDDWVPPLTMV